MNTQECEECPICITTYNKTKLLCAVVCPHCQYKVCNRCMRQYMTSSNQEPHCMKCRVGWNPEFVMTQFPKTFLSGDLRHHRETVLIERQKAMLAETMPHLELDNRSIKRKEAIKFLRTEVRIMKTKIMLLEDLENRDCVENPFDEMTLTNVMEERHLEIQNLRGIINRDVTYDQNGFHIIRKPEAETTRTYRVQPCPAEGCTGFLSSNYQCMKCALWICRHCLQIKKGGEEDKGHECDANLVESVRVIRSQYRSCPKCGVMIEKSMGCSQIWCTQCHTAFDYNTGKIETHIHNPHYYEWLRRTGQQRNDDEDNDVDCPQHREMDRRFDARFIERRLRGFTDLSEENRETLLAIHRWSNHILNVSRNLQRDIQDVNPTRKLRIAFLRGVITEHKWKIQLLRLDRLTIKNTNYMQLMSMFTDTIYDLYVSMTAENAQDLNKQIGALMDYYREQFEILVKNYGQFEAARVPENWRHV